MPKYSEKAPLWVCITANTIAWTIALIAIGIELYGCSHDNFLCILISWPLFAVPGAIEMWLEKKYTSPENYQRYKDAVSVTYVKLLKYTILAPFYIIAAAYMVFFHKTFK